MAAPHTTTRLLDERLLLVGGVPQVPAGITSNRMSSFSLGQKLRLQRATRPTGLDSVAGQRT